MSKKLKLLYVVLIALAVFTLWPGDDGRDTSSIRVWNAHINDNGRLNVLGVVLGESTLKQAEAALHSQSERALFVEMKDEGAPRETIEAFFPTSPDRAKLVIELEADTELLSQIKQRAYNPMAFPSGNVKLEIAPEDNATVEALTTKSLTYIPPVSLKPTVIEQQFGKPGEQIRDQDGNLHLLYPDLGLDVVLPPNDKALLQFVPPSQFDRLQALIMRAAAPEERR